MGTAIDVTHQPRVAFDDTATFFSTDFFHTRLSALSKKSVEKKSRGIDQSGSGPIEYIGCGAHTIFCLMWKAFTGLWESDFVIFQAFRLNR